MGLEVKGLFAIAQVEKINYMLQDECENLSWL